MEERRPAAGGGGATTVVEGLGSSIVASGLLGEEGASVDAVVLEEPPELEVWVTRS